MNFLREPITGEVAHSSTSAAFIKNPSLSDWALFMTSTSAMMASQTVEATEKYGATNSKTQTTYNVWKNTDAPFFDSIKESKELTRQFANYMKNVTSGKGTSIQHLLTGFDWASLGEATVVDVCPIPLHLCTSIFQGEACTDQFIMFIAGRFQWPRQHRPRRSVSKAQVYCAGPS